MPYFGGANTDAVTVDLLRELQRVSGEAILLTQGSYSTTVSASGGTHDGGGVVDINVSGWNYTVIWKVLTAARSMGLIAWYRTPSQGFAYHIHTVRRDCGDLSPAARAQVVQYLAGQNGLANHGPDDGPLGYTSVTWASYQAGTSAYRPPINITPEDDMFETEDRDRMKNLERIVNDVWTQGRVPGQPYEWLPSINDKIDKLGAVHADLAELRRILNDVWTQGRAGNQPFEWLPALNDKLDAILKRLG